MVRFAPAELPRSCDLAAYRDLLSVGLGDEDRAGPLGAFLAAGAGAPQRPPPRRRVTPNGDATATQDDHLQPRVPRRQAALQRCDGPMFFELVPGTWTCTWCGHVIPGLYPRRGK